MRKKAASYHSISFGKVAATDVVLRKDVGSTLVANDVSGCYATGYALNAYAFDNLVLFGIGNLFLCNPIFPF